MTRLIEGEVVILDRAAGVVHQLNATAGRVWSSCDGTASTQAIAEQLVADYEVALETALRDVETTIGRLQALGLLDFEHNGAVPTGGRS